MNYLNDQPIQSRRKFFSLLVTSSAPLCFGCGFLFAKPNQENMKHKFLSDSEMSYEEVFKYLTSQSQ